MSSVKNPKDRFITILLIIATCLGAVIIYLFTLYGLLLLAAVIPSWSVTNPDGTFTPSTPVALLCVLGPCVLSGGYVLFMLLQMRRRRKVGEPQLPIDHEVSLHPHPQFLSEMGNDLHITVENICSDSSSHIDDNDHYNRCNSISHDDALLKRQQIASLEQLIQMICGLKDSAPNMDATIALHHSHNLDIAFAEYLNYPRYDEFFEDECKTIIKDQSLDTSNPYEADASLRIIAGDCITPTNDYEMELKINSYRYANANDRLIKYIPYYLKHGSFSGADNPVSCKSFFISTLAASYYCEGNYKTAAAIYDGLYSCFPDNAEYAVALIRTLNILEAFDTSLTLISNLKISKYYQLERFRDEINRVEIETSKKIAAFRNRADYAWLQVNLPDICPKSLNGYSRMKNINSANYQKIKEAAANIGYTLT